MKPLPITSPQNPVLKNIRRAASQGTVTDEGWSVAEGFHLLDEALRSGVRVHAIFVAGPLEGAVVDRLRGRADEVRLYSIPDPLFRGISSTESPQGVIALVEPPQWTLEQVLDGDSLVVVLDGIQEPGNAGAIVRAAEAFGATGVVFLKRTVNPHNPKAMRAAAGSLFRIPYITGVEDRTLLDALRKNGIEIFAALPAAALSIGAADLRRKCALILGSEGSGIRADLAVQAVAVSIPTVGVESLNAAVAAGILLYEARRQRKLNS